MQVEAVPLEPTCSS